MLFAIPKQLILYRLSVFARMKDYNFAHKLLAWYHENRRILQWRDTHDPYIIWISEIILQQTRGVQGYDYFLRFMNEALEVYKDTEEVCHVTCHMLDHKGELPDTFLIRW